MCYINVAPPAGNMAQPPPIAGYNLEGLEAIKSAILRAISELSQQGGRMCASDRARLRIVWLNNKENKQNCVTEMTACCIELAEKYSLTEALSGLKNVDPVSLRAALFERRVRVHKMQRFWDDINLVAVERIQNNFDVNNAIARAIANCKATNSIIPQRFISTAETQMSGAQLAWTLRELRSTTDICVSILCRVFTIVCEFRQYRSLIMERDGDVSTEIISMLHDYRAKLVNNYISW